MNEIAVKVYLVGGAVRDRLLGLEIKDRDHLVTGATPKQMLDLGYQQVGKQFPVFLHPKTHQEYALARTEKKAGAGYTGFVCDFSPEITVEQDLIRRDLTINAMAETEDGTLIDPFGGQQDIKNRVLRHVSDAFAEDPLRVLRVARFAARFAHLDFSVAKETLLLMKQLSISGELQALTPERIWQETEKALATQSPWRYFEILHQVGALSELLPELDQLWGIPNPAQWHPEIDTGVHTMMVLRQASLLSDDLSVRFAALCHDFGKGITPKIMWPHHSGHEKAGLVLIEAVCERLRIPNDFRELALLVSEFHTHSHRVMSLRAKTILKLLNRLDVWRQAPRFERFLITCLADLRGRTGFENADYPQAQFLRDCYQRCLTVDVKTIVASGKKGLAIKQEIERQRIALINQLKAEQI